HLLRRLFAVRHGRPKLACQQRKRFRIVVRPGEIQVEQLQGRFELRGRRAARNAVLRQADVRRGGRQLACQQLLEVERLETTHAGEPDVRGDKLRLGQVRTRRQ